MSGRAGRGAPTTLAEVLAARVTDAAAALAHSAALMADEPPAPGIGRRVAELRELLNLVVESAGMWEAHAGAGPERLAGDLGLSVRTIAKRYGGGPRDLPLLAVLSDLGAD